MVSHVFPALSKPRKGQRRRRAAAATNYVDYDFDWWHKVLGGLPSLRELGEWGLQAEEVLRERAPTEPDAPVEAHFLLLTGAGWEEAADPSWVAAAEWLPLQFQAVCELVDNGAERLFLGVWVGFGLLADGTPWLLMGIPGIPVQSEVDPALGDRK
jgi:hypothetical protein